jgi:hypothetical protein
LETLKTRFTVNILDPKVSLAQKPEVKPKSESKPESKPKLEP